MRLPISSRTKRGPAVLHPFIGTLETENFRTVEFKLAEFTKLAKGGPGLGAPEFRAARDAYHDDRFKQTSAHLKSNPVIPQDVRGEAAKHSNALVFSFTGFRSKIVRGQPHGSLDSSRLARLASPGMSIREFDRLAASAYRRREHVQSEQIRPRIAICADMNNHIRSRNLNYMKLLGRLAYVVGEAAKLSGVEVAVYASRGWGNPHNVDESAEIITVKAGLTDKAKRPHLVTTVKDWGDEITGSEYAVFTDNVPNTRVVSPLPLFQAAHMLTGKAHGVSSDCGAGCVEFARAQGAQIVIAFGNFDKSETADVIFQPGASVDAVVEGIVSHMTHGKAA